MEAIEIVSVVVGLLVIIIEVIILYRLRQHQKELDQHTKKLEENVEDLDRHSHRMEQTIKTILTETEQIYKRTCEPLVAADKSK